MKQLITIASLLIIALACKAQVAHTYNQVQTIHFDKDGTVKSEITAHKSGQITIDDKVIDVAGADRLVYSIFRTDKPEVADNGYHTQTMYAMLVTKAGTMKLAAIVYLIKPNGSIQSVIFKNSKSTHVVYDLDKGVSSTAALATGD